MESNSICSIMFLGFIHVASISSSLWPLFFFFFFWLHWVFAAALRLSLVDASRGYYSLLCAGFSLQQLLIVEHGLNSYGAWACCSLACEIFLEYGWNPCPVHWQAGSYPLYHQGSPGLCLSEIRASPVSKGLILLLLFSKFPCCSSLSQFPYFLVSHQTL